jgi:23S rRNA (cytidine1920-2'-O)/16S rRNA (cytidine1409-2'-O)-methyltransferase
VLEELLAWAGEHNLVPQGLVRSAIEGSDGNVEFLVWLQPGGPESLDQKAAIAAVLSGVDEPGAEQRRNAES